MKKLTLLLIGLLTLSSTSCDSGYSEKTCEEILTKYDNRHDRSNLTAKLTADDYAEAVSQCNAILDEMLPQLDKVISLAEGNDGEAVSLWQEMDGSTMSKHFFNLYYMLKSENCRGKLQGDIQKGYKDLDTRLRGEYMEKNDEAKEKMINLNKSLRD